MKRILYSLCFLLLLAGIVCPLSSQAQKSKTKAAAFTVEALPDELLTFLNGATKDEERQTENAQAVGQMNQLYQSCDEAMQQRIVDMYNAIRGTKLSSLPDYLTLTRTLVAYGTVEPASRPDADILGQWVAAVTALPSITFKGKEIVGFINYSAELLASRTLYRSRTSIWMVQAGAHYSFEVGKRDIKTIFSQPIELTYSSGTGSNDDANTIFGTTGNYFFIDNAWYGHGGRITWQRCDLPLSECYADLADYEAETKFPKIHADSVSFVNTRYFPSAILGTLEDVVNTRTEPDKYTFPKFRSYQKDFLLKDIAPSVDFEGSFMMYGPRFVTNDDKNPASMVFYRNGKRFLIVTATKFNILPEVLIAERAAVKMNLGDSDSLCNAGVLVRYTTKDQKVMIMNDRKRNFYSPYTDSYHQFDIYCGSINWLIDKDVVEFQMVAQENTRTFVTFESNRFYSQRKDREVKGIEETSPVVRVYRFMKANGMKRDFPLAALQTYVKMDVTQTKLMIHTLSASGLVSYDEATSRIHVNDKLIGFYKAIVKQKGHDYDALTLESDTKEVNALLDLKSNDLHVRGVEKFVVSDSQLVVVKPYGGDLTVQRNRDILFSGLIHVGRFEMNVTGGMFRYADFKLDLPQIDSLRFYVTDFSDPNKTVWVRTPLYQLQGDIQIDLPDNHCGLTKNKDYPIFNSTQPSHVFYDRPFIFDGVYHRDRFHYDLHPFVIKQLTDFKTDSMAFNGVLVSAGIFPDIAEPLRVQRDYSLGFVVKAPVGGFPTYGGKGTFYKQVDLSYRGLRGEGTLSYLTSTTQGSKYLFMPDSMVAVSDTFYVHDEQDYPEVHNSQTLLRWYPYSDSLTVSQLQKGPQFQMYHGISQLAGRLMLQPQGASASGTITINDGTLKSEDFKLRTTEMDARVTRFTLHSKQYHDIAFQADNMRSHVDYEEHTGQFNANDTLQRTLLPAMGLAAWVDQYLWNWDHLFLALDNSKSMETGGLETANIRERNQQLGRMPGARFESTDPKMQHLAYNAIHSTYHYNDEELTNHNVFALPIADATIAPAADTLHVSRGGVVQLLHDAEVLFPRQGAFHRFYGCDVMVANGQQYSGKGTIDYLGIEDKPQPIAVSEIASSAEGSRAKGFVPDTAHFTLSEAFGFAGEVRIDAAHPLFFFDGGVRLLHQCISEGQLALLAYSDYLDPTNIRVHVSENPIDWKGQRVNACLLQGVGLAPTMGFLTKRDKGVEMLPAHGVLHYDANTKGYTITSAERMEDSDVVAPWLTLNAGDCTLEGEGPVTFASCEGPASFYAYGKAFLNSENMEDFSLRTVFGFNFPIDNGLLNQLAQHIEEDLRPEPADRENELLNHALVVGMGDEAGDEAYNTYLAQGAYDKIPACLNHTLLFENVKWEYSPNRGYTANCITALSHVGKKQLHVNVRLRAQFYKRGNETFLALYMQVAKDHWYFFRYSPKTQRLGIASSVGEWNDRLTSLKAEKRQSGDYSYGILASHADLQSFLNAFGGADESGEELEEDSEE